MGGFLNIPKNWSDDNKRAARLSYVRTEWGWQKLSVPFLCEAHVGFIVDVQHFFPGLSHGIVSPFNNVDCVLNRTPLYLCGVIFFPQGAIELHIPYVQWVPVRWQRVNLTELWFPDFTWEWFNTAPWDWLIYH